MTNIMLLFSLITTVSADVKYSCFRCLLSASKGICICLWFAPLLPECVHRYIQDIRYKYLISTSFTFRIFHEI